MPTNVDPERSRQITSKARTKPKQCFANAIRCAKRFDLTYVQGYATIEFGLALEHAWCEDQDGVIIEVTPVWLEDIEKTNYFPVVRITLPEIEAGAITDPAVLFRQHNQEFLITYNAAREALLSNSK